MSKRTRHYVVLAVVAIVGGVFARVAGHWSDVAFYATAAGLLAVIGLAGLFWLESAPDGAFRRRPLRG